jgi:DNA-binding response OmpR family regulator
MSGYMPEGEHDRQLDRAVFLAKPFPPAELFTAVDKALRRAVRGASCPSS